SLRDSRGGADIRTIVALVGPDDSCDDNDTLATSCTVVGGTPLTGLVVGSNPAWYRFSTTGQGGTSHDLFPATITIGQGNVQLTLYTPTEFFWKATRNLGGGNVAAVSWATSAINITYYFAVWGTPGLTYSVEVILLPT